MIIVIIIMVIVIMITIIIIIIIINNKNLLSFLTLLVFSKLSSVSNRRLKAIKDD